ncbi:MAG: hypothetical protein AB1567_03305 [bacterium]
MGIFYVDTIIENIQSSKECVLVKKLMVDTGAEYTWIPEEDLKKASITIKKKGCAISDG